MPDHGKYAFAVLDSYGATLAMLGAIVLVTWQRGVRVREALRAMEQKLGARRADADDERERAGADG